MLLSAKSYLINRKALKFADLFSHGAENEGRVDAHGAVLGDQS